MREHQLTCSCTNVEMHWPQSMLWSLTRTVLTVCEW